MNKKFVKTKNVKEFVGFMEELKSLPPNIPKIALVYGDYGLGKSETIKWWTFKNDCVYVRATKRMSVRWLLSEIAEELGEKLVCEIIKHARNKGYKKMVLDTIKPLKAAIHLYKKFGFIECEPYYNNPMII